MAAASTAGAEVPRHDDGAPPGPSAGLIERSEIRPAGSGGQPPECRSGSSEAPRKEESAAPTTARREYDSFYKIALVGDSPVGKTCILQRFVDRTFEEQTSYTVGVDYKVKTVDVNGKRAKLMILDSAGQERFRGVTVKVYRGAHGFIVVYDITDRASYDTVPYWVRLIDEYARKHVCRMLVGNACDLDSKRQVDTAEARAFAQEHGMLFLETSAKDGTNVDEAIMTMAREIQKRASSEDGSVSSQTATVVLGQETGSGGCF